MIRIEKGIVAKPLKKGSKFPFKQMKVGDSFVQDIYDYKSASTIRSVLNTHTEKRFIVRKQDDGNYRFFRVK